MDKNSTFRARLLAQGQSKNVEDRRVKYGDSTTLRLEYSAQIGKMMEEHLRSLIRVHNDHGTRITQPSLRKRMDELRAPNKKVPVSQLKIRK
jgi:hypothetical protein